MEYVIDFLIGFCIGVPLGLIIIGFIILLRNRP